ncbi:MAG: hypothetical protein LC800_04875 [Acidobacteria bacterium]|nr:hypothetical protein [Acidobacteriota bacterium]
MRRMLIALVVALPALFASGPKGGAEGRVAPPARQHEKWFLAAVLRADGVVVPFATYWHGYWLTPWPAPAGYPAEENSLFDQPAAWFAQDGEFARDWYAGVPKGGAATLRLRASRLVEVDNHCGKNWGLMTDYPGAKPGAGGHGNVGLALSGPGEIVASAKLGPGATGLGPVRALVRRTFDEDEASQLARPDAAQDAKSFPARAARARRAPVITSLHRVELEGGRRLYYFEAERRYPKPRGARDAACENVSALSGTLLQEGRGVPRFVERQFGLSDCDGKWLSCNFPLGLIRDAGREFLIMLEHGYEDESYAIMELLRGGTLRRLRRVEGGGC